MCTLATITVQLSLGQLLSLTRKNSRTGIVHIHQHTAPQVKERREDKHKSEKINTFTLRTIGCFIEQ